MLTRIRPSERTYASYRDSRLFSELRLRGIPGARFEEVCLANSHRTPRWAAIQLLVENDWATLDTVPAPAAEPVTEVDALGVVAPDIAYTEEVIAAMHAEPDVSEPPAKARLLHLVVEDGAKTACGKTDEATLASRAPSINDITCRACLRSKVYKAATEAIRATWTS